MVEQEFVSLTEQAAKQIKDNIFKSSHQYLRFGVKQSGCTGFRYVIEVSENINANDIELESKGVKIIVDADSVDFIKGTVIDYEKRQFSEMFTFDNPLVKAQCGCGESFST